MKPIRVLVCPDAFKGSLEATAAAAAMRAGVLAAAPSATVDVLPMADGGEGTAAALVAATGGRWQAATVSGPAGRPVAAGYGVLGDGETAVVEAASAAGLLLLRAGERNPRRTSSRGVGELLAATLRAGHRRLILTLGGTGTNDGGLGLWQGLGGRALTSDGLDAGPGGDALAQVARLDAAGLPAALAETEIIVATDVDNPLLGPQGATAVYGPQKGADPTAVRELEAGMARWAQLLHQTYGRDVAGLAGAGAAGGMAVPLLALGRARLAPGFDLVAQHSGLARAVAAADLVVTGEGRIDGQTLHGKVVAGVGALARAAGRPCLAVGGQISPGAEALHAHGVTALLALPRGPSRLAELVRDAAPLLTRATEAGVRLFCAGRAASRPLAGETVSQ